MHLPLRRASVIGVSVALAVGGGAAVATAASAHPTPKADPAVHFTVAHRTATPIKHVVVIYQENVSFDHYFGTYPDATNTSGQTFTAKRGTPKVNGLTPALKNNNPNGVNPVRYDPTNVNDVLTCDQDHNYSDEQLAVDGGKNDLYPLRTGNGTGTTPEGGKCVAGDVMNYYDGNTVTGFWNYAQQYAMSDSSFDTTYGPSSPGAINVVSGDTGNVDMTHTANNPSIATASSPNADITADGLGGYSLTSDAQPYYDDCSTRDAVALSGKNIGDELNAKGISWGWFQGGFKPSTSYTDALAAIGKSGQATSTFTPDEFSAYFSVAANRPAHSSNQNLCSTVTPVGAGLSAPLATGAGQYGYKDDYIPHHEPFQYYASTANPHHVTVPATASGTGLARRAGHHRQGHPVLHQRRAAVQHAEPQLRHLRLRPARRGDHRAPAAGVGAARRELPQGTGLGGRAPRLLRPAGRAEVGHHRDQRPDEVPGLGLHRGDHLLRRL